MTLSLHKLWAGSGYEYLTRQVARQDGTHIGRSSLASYYTERGETPGVWVGRGVEDIGGLAVGDVVTSEQMRYLFGAGVHPLAAAPARASAASGAAAWVASNAERLGSPFRLPSARNRAFEVEVERRLAVPVAGTGNPSEAAADARSRLVSVVAAEWFERDHGRPPADARELAATVARWSRRPAQPVAGFDLTFSPVKSVSALWAVAPLPLAAGIERAHQAAVADALRFVEERALFTREGTNGVRQVEVCGLVGTAFTHRDSRAGDPDLHTHVAVANKVQTRQGRWLAVDGRVLYAATVAASETYNTALERHLGERLGLRFADRATTGGRRCVREVVGLDERLLAVWSSRRQAIDVRRAELGKDFQRRTGRPPTRQESWALAQQATLDTRHAKHEPRSLTEQRAAWSGQAAEVLGGARQVEAMVSRAVTPVAQGAEQVGAAWVAQAATGVVAVMEGERAMWGRFHLHAEVQRRVRGAGLAPGLTAQVVDLVVAEATNQSVPLRAPEEAAEPPGLCRSDGVSVYETVGSQRWTSRRVLDAEQQVLMSAARRDGRRIDSATVEVALGEAAVEGVVLNAGQVGLVRDLAGSGARVQLALAPAGTGKTTALHVLAKAWSAAGGTVVGLAPSASAASVLGEHLGGPTDTLAKLVWSLDHPEADPPAWVAGLGPRSLVVVDEAGLADTPSLARAVAHVVGVGGSVRLVGDDRQLGAVGAGGLLRDLDARFGAARLDVVVRFADPAEAAASLALREGRKESLGFYLDLGRVHVGDASTAAEQLLDAWADDRAAGRNTLMLAPTRSAVADLNRRARHRRLDGQQPSREAGLADGNHASAGDTVVTRTNDRRLRLSGHGWVRNGAQWTVMSVEHDGAVTAVPVGGGPSLQLPAAYVTASVELGYASTVHAAQGLTCDAVHGLVTGAESRTELYTLLTRGRLENHLYLQLDATTDLHDLGRPDDGAATTPTEVLERLLAREGTSRSATGLLADLHDPSLRLPLEIARYVDALHLAVDRTADPGVTDRLDRLAGRLLPGLLDAPAWPTLRSGLLLHAADGADPEHRLRLVIASGPLDDGRDPAAVLHQRLSRLDGHQGQGPLPWLPHLPRNIDEHPTWGTYLHARAELVILLAHQVHQQATTTRPVWTRQLHPDVDDQVVGQLAVWRAAQQVEAADPNLTGPPATEMAARRWQQHLNPYTGSTWTEPTPQLVEPLTAAADHDPFRHTLALNLGRLARQGVDIDRHLQAAASEQPLPDDHPSAALWWRLHRRIPAATLTATDRLPEPLPLLHPQDADQHHTSGPREVPSPVSREGRTDTALLVAGLLRIGRRRPTPEPPAEAGPVTAERDRLVDVNRLAHDYYRSQLTGSWSGRYLAERCGQDLAEDDRFQVGHAPYGWTGLVNHLHRLGVPEDDMVGAGLALRTRQGHVVDRFRDRLILPIWDQHQTLIGFVARRRPDLDEPHGAPKYLNTPTTALFTKGDQLYGSHLLPPAGGRSATNPDSGHEGKPMPVLVEGPLDAIAVTLAGRGRYVGLATLGTALTQPQAALVAGYAVDPVLALDGDPAGQAAATRNFWQLTQQGLDPLLAALPPRLDPADVLTQLGPAGLYRLLDEAAPQGEHLLGRAHGPSLHLLLRITAARPPRTWTASIDDISRRQQVPVQALREQLLPLALDATVHPADAARRGEALMASRTGTTTAPPTLGARARAVQVRPAPIDPAPRAHTPGR